MAWRSQLNGPTIREGLGLLRLLEEGAGRALPGGKGWQELMGQGSDTDILDAGQALRDDPEWWRAAPDIIDWEMEPYSAWLWIARKRIEWRSAYLRAKLGLVLLLCMEDG